MTCRLIGSHTRHPSIANRTIPHTSSLAERLVFTSVVLVGNGVISIGESDSITGNLTERKARDRVKSRVNFSWKAEIVQLTATMDKQSDKKIAGKKQRNQMLKLVAKGFYNELTNYNVHKNEIL